MVRATWLSSVIRTQFTPPWPGRRWPRPGAPRGRRPPGGGATKNAGDALARRRQITGRERGEGRGRDAIAKGVDHRVLAHAGGPQAAHPTTRQGTLPRLGVGRHVGPPRPRRARPRASRTSGRADPARAGDGPALFDHLAEPQSTFGRERSVTVHPEPPWLCGCVNSSTMPWRLTSSGDIPRQQRPWVEHR